MKQLVCTTAIGVMLLLVGCTSVAPWKTAKFKQGSAATQTVTSTVGSPDFSNSKKLKNPVKMHLAYAGWHEQSGNYQEARESYLKVLKKNPKDLEANLGLARIDREYDREAEADERLQKMLKKHPKDPRVFVAIGQVHAARKEWSEAWNA